MQLGGFGIGVGVFLWYWFHLGFFHPRNVRLVRQMQLGGCEGDERIEITVERPQVEQCMSKQPLGTNCGASVFQFTDSV